MPETDKTMEQLREDVTALRQQVADLKATLANQHEVQPATQAAPHYAEHIVETLREALLVLDGNLQIIKANLAFYRLFNVTPEETEHCLLYELGNGQWDIPRLRLLLEEILPTNSNFDDFEVTHTFPYLGRRTMLLNARRLRLGGAATTQILLAIEDATARREAEAALRVQRDWFNGTLSSIGDGVIATDVHGTIVFLNSVAEVLTGWSAAEAQGQAVTAVFRIVNEHTRQPVVDDLVSRVLREGRAIGLANHTLLLTRHGAEIPIADSAAPIRDRHGQLHGLVLVFRDGTAMRQLEAQLYQTQKIEALGTLAGGIAHGFNNMLAAILGFNQLAQREVAPESRAAGYLHEVRTASLRAKDLVQQMLTFSHQDVHEHHALELRLLVHETLRLLRVILPATIELRVQLNTHGGMVLGDPTQLQQVLLNLASNAEYAMRPSGGVLEIMLAHKEVSPTLAARYRALRPGPHLCLRVRDTGTGMAPESLERIFEPFFTTKGVGEGTGMGLAIVHGVVVGHGGAIVAESRLGQGTTFTIYLPRLPDAPLTVSSPEMPLPQGQERLLVVEDDEALARLAQVQLTELGYAVSVCTSSGEALALFQADPQAFDLVLTDQTMPHMTGDVLAQELRRRRPELPIILLTGYNPLIDAAKARALGIDAFLLKPVGLHELAQAIRQVLAQRQV
jgi:PAS domain S-box-containing protein